MRGEEPEEGQGGVEKSLRRTREEWEELQGPAIASRVSFLATDPRGL